MDNKEKIDNNFEEIDNPWTDEKEMYWKEFDYILKEKNYLIQRNSIKLRSIKSKHKFEKNKIYKLKYDISIINDNFRVGLGDFGNCNSRLKEKGSIGLTKEGLYIEGNKVSEIKIIKDNKEIIFIINLKDNPNNFEVFIDGKNCGKFNCNLKTIYGLAAIYEGSITINILRSLN